MYAPVQMAGLVRAPATALQTPTVVIADSAPLSVHILPQRGHNPTEDHSQVLKHFSCKQCWEIKTWVVALQFWAGI